MNKLVKLIDNAIDLCGVNSENAFEYIIMTSNKLAKYESTELEPKEIIELKNNYEQLIKDWAKSRADVFKEQYDVFKKICDNCKDGTAVKTAQAAYEKQLKWKEEAQAENKRLKEFRKLYQNNYCKLVKNWDEIKILRTENKRLEKALELLANYYLYHVEHECGMMCDMIHDEQPDICSECQETGIHVTDLNKVAKCYIQYFKQQAAEADKKGE